ncbi:MAG TPA: hypothetical protein VM123_14715 [archaeon]|nr:hypothetical protein [archaeon]
MSLRQWANEGWLKPHTTSAQEIGSLLAIVDRDITDTSKNISEDWRFSIAYNAALKLCTILLYSKGYRAERTLQHYRTIQALPLILGPSRKEDTDYLDHCRKKRNIIEYNHVGCVTEQDAEELIDFIKELRQDVINWLKKHHPRLLNT